MYQATTHGIIISVEPLYMEAESRPLENHYFWAYRITIDNQSAVAVQLRSRYWHIVDGDGQTEEVKGEGVVGEQPLIAPGKSYKYTSGCPLSTPHGLMSGHYMMETHDGDHLQIAIPAFSLDLPDARRVLN